jgi:hypothetical protein
MNRTGLGLLPIQPKALWNVFQLNEIFEVGGGGELEFL